MTGRTLRSFGLWGAGLVLASAVLLATVWTPMPHSGGDNAGYLALAHSLASGTGYVELWDPATPPHTKYPPGLPLMLGALVLAGASSWTAFKLFSAICLSAAALLTYAWATDRRGPMAGAAVAFLALLSAGWLDASRWVLSEPVFLAWTFLALWAAGRGESLPAEAGVRWIAVAGAAAIAAFLTRSAGLPLVLALLLGLLLGRRFRAAAIFAGVFAIPAGWWMARARGGGGEGAYQSEFWLVNPYEPELGGIGWLDLPGRVWTNLQIYLGEVLPGEWWSGVGEGGPALLGIGLAGLAVWGWSLRLRRRAPGTAELFAPLYFGLILLWPPVWSGDRFLLPLVPLVLLYGGEALRWAGRSFGGVWGVSLVSAGFLVLAAPAVPAWMATASEAAACRRVAGSMDGFACHGPGFREFREASAWIGANLPADAVVLSRKPRILYLLGGRPGYTFPFTRDPGAFLAEADRNGARYLLMDHVDGISPFYLPAVIQGRPLAFCYIAGWGGGAGMPGTDLFGILPPEGRRMGGDVAQLEPCPAGYVPDPREAPLTDGARIPRLVGR